MFLHNLCSDNSSYIKTVSANDTWRNAVPGTCINHATLDALKSGVARVSDADHIRVAEAPIASEYSDQEH